MVVGDLAEARGAWRNGVRDFAADVGEPDAAEEVGHARRSGVCGWAVVRVEVEAVVVAVFGEIDADLRGVDEVDSFLGTGSGSAQPEETG